MKAKNSQHSTKKVVKPKNDSEWEQYLNMISFQLEPATSGFFKRLAIELYTWARENEKSYSVEEFLHLKGIPTGSFYRWVEKYPEVKQSNEEALSIFSIRRERGAIEKKLDGQMVRWSLPLFSKRFKDLEEWRSKLNKDKEESGNKIVVIEKFAEKQ